MELPSLIQRLRAKGWKDIEQICEKVSVAYNYVV